MTALAVKNHNESDKDEVMKPFFSRSLGDIAVDAMCVCGHLQSEHDAKFTPLPNGKRHREYEAGKCVEHGCTCEQFQWKRWVAPEEFADIKQKNCVTT